MKESTTDQMTLLPPENTMKLPLPPFQPELRLAAYDTLPYLFYASSAEPLSLRELDRLHDADVIAQLADLQLGYAPTGGHPALLAELARYYGPPISERDVLTFPGAQTAIFATLASMLKPADHAIVVGPCYPSLFNIPAAICDTTRVDLRFDRQWSLELDEIEDSIRANTRIIILNSPNSPTGTLISRSTQDALVEIARQRNLWIFSDEVYRLLEIDQDDRLPPMALAYERGISLGAMSKPFGLGGLLIGWIACRDQSVLEATARFKHYLAVCNSAVAELHAVTALRNTESIVGDRRRICRENLRLLDNFFTEFADVFDWVRPHSGCVGFPQLRSGMAADAFAEHLAHGPGVLIMPASAFDFEGDFFRIGFGRTTMPRSLEVFAEFVHRNISQSS